MKPITGILALLLSLSLLTGCGGQQQAGDPPPSRWTPLTAPETISPVRARLPP